MSVYRLIFPNGKSYVGVAYDPLARFKQHTKSDYPVGQAIRKHGKNAVQCQILFKGSPELCYEAESALIAELDCLAPRGYNIAPGGRGVREHSPEMRKRMGAAVSAALSTPENRKRASERASKQWSDPEMLARSREANIKTWSDPDRRRRHGELMREINSRQAVSEAASKRAKAMWADPERRARLLEGVKDNGKRPRVNGRFIKVVPE